MSRPRPTTRASRRAALGLGLVVLGGAGCSGEAGTSAPPSGTPGARRSQGARARQGDAAPAADPDTALVALVLAEISRAHAQVQANRRAHRPLAGQLRSLERLHARHAAELGGLVEVPALAITVEPRQERVLARLGRLENRLQQRLVRESVDADSGALALLLASMAAGVAQERAFL